jgi:hypothetical protein
MKIEASPTNTKQLIHQEDILAFPFDLEDFIEHMPPEACTKGHFAQQYHDIVRELRPEAFEEFNNLYPDKLAAFRDVPRALVQRRAADAARLAYPDLPLLEGLRRISRLVYPRMLDLMLGRVIFAALGKELMAIFRHGPRAFELFEKNGTRAAFTQLGPRYFRYDFQPSYMVIEASQIGIIEGAAMYCHAQTEITVKRQDRYHGSLECRWSF